MRVPPLNLQGSGGGGGGTGMDRLPLPLSFSPDMLWRYPVPFSPAALPSSPAAYDFKTQMPNQLPTDPRHWAREDVCQFLQWCEREFELPPIELDRFRMNGKALCMLNKSDLTERAPGAGDVVHNALQMLLRDAVCRLPASPLTPHSLSAPNSATSVSPSWPMLTSTASDSGAAHGFPALLHASTSVTLSPASSLDSQCASPKRTEQKQLLFPGAPLSTGSSKQTTPSDSEDSRDSESPQRSPVNAPLSPSYHAAVHAVWAKQQQQAQQQQQERQQQQQVHHQERQQQQHVQQLQRDPGPPPPSPGETPESGSGGRLLWDFLQQLLNDPMQRFNSLIAWKNVGTGVFKIVDPQGLARLWGVQKNHLSMNYDKMSRALRYYYRVNILRKVQGERHCYQFLRNPNELKSVKNISMLRGTAPKMAPRSPVSQMAPRSPVSPHRLHAPLPPSGDSLHPLPHGAEALHALPQGTEVIQVEHKPAYEISAAAAAAHDHMDEDEGPTDLSMPQDLTIERRQAVAMDTEQQLVPPLMQIKVDESLKMVRSCVKVEASELVKVEHGS